MPSWSLVGSDSANNDDICDGHTSSYSLSVAGAADGDLAVGVIDGRVADWNVSDLHPAELSGDDLETLAVLYVFHVDDESCQLREFVSGFEDDVVLKVGSWLASRFSYPSGSGAPFTLTVDGADDVVYGDQILCTGPLGLLDADHREQGAAAYSSGGDMTASIDPATDGGVGGHTEDFVFYCAAPPSDLYGWGIIVG